MVQTVLSIDDDNITQVLNNIYLESSGICNKVIELFDGQEALSFFKKIENGEEPIENFPDIIFLDLNMPIMDGWEFFDAFESNFPQFIEKTKIFILSSSINPSDEERAKKEKNIVCFLPKPLDEIQLQRVKSLLGF